MTTDLIKGELSAEQQQTIIQALLNIQAKMPFMVDLTMEERRSLPKMGDKSRAFVDQGLVLAMQNLLNRWTHWAHGSEVDWVSLILIRFGDLHRYRFR